MKELYECIESPVAIKFAGHIVELRERSYVPGACREKHNRDCTSTQHERIFLAGRYLDLIEEIHAPATVDGEPYTAIATVHRDLEGYRAMACVNALEGLPTADLAMLGQLAKAIHASLGAIQAIRKWEGNKQ